MATTAPSPLKRYFTGFSTQNSTQTGKTTLYDIDLINIDLMTAFQTRIGERVMRPDWGCRLWDYVMEPLTTPNVNAIIAEAIRICETDSRLTFMGCQVFEQDSGFRIELTLQYKPWLVISNFSATFENNDMIYFNSTPTSNLLIG